MPDFGATSISGLENDFKYREAVNAANLLVNRAKLNSDSALDMAKNRISASEYAGGQQRQSGLLGDALSGGVSAVSGFAYNALRDRPPTPTPFSNNYVDKVTYPSDYWSQPTPFIY